MRKRSKGLAGLKHMRRQAAQAAAKTPGGAQAGGDASGANADASSRQARTASPLSRDDVTLFRRAAGGASPLRAAARASLPPVPAGTRAQLSRRRQWASGQWTSGRDAPAPAAVSDQFSPADTERDPTRYIRIGHGPDLLRDLKRGKWPMQASLDLHGSTLAQARARLDQFLLSCLAHGIRCVQIIHGKGFGSRDGTPVLKESVRRWLTQFDAVLAYIECDGKSGGAGAVQVLLRAPGAPLPSTRGIP